MKKGSVDFPEIIIKIPNMLNLEWNMDLSPIHFRPFLKVSVVEYLYNNVKKRVLMIF